MYDLCKNVYTLDQESTAQQLNSFHLNGHTLAFHPQTRKRRTTLHSYHHHGALSSTEASYSRALTAGLGKTSGGWDEGKGKRVGERSVSLPRASVFCFIVVY